MSQRVIAITGGTGFIGRALVGRHVAEGDIVRVLTRSGLRSPDDGSRQVFHGDLASGTGDMVPFVDGADVLYHCAAELSDATRMQAVHVQGTRRLLDAARGRAGRWVQLSSVGAYGPRRAGEVTEANPDQPLGPYETTKAAADLLVERELGLEYSILRPSNVFGTAMTNRSLWQWIAMIDRGLFAYVGRPGASANYLHVDNVVDALMRCATSSKAVGRTYIVSDFRPMEQFVGAIATALGRRPPHIRVPEIVARGVAAVGGVVPGVPLTRSRVDALSTRVTYSTERITSELSYEPVVTVEDGLRAMVAEHRARVSR